MLPGFIYGMESAWTGSTSSLYIYNYNVMSLARGTLLGLSQSVLSSRDLFNILVDEVCTCLGNGLFSIFFALATASFTLMAGLTSFIITSEFTFHTQTAGLHLGRHLIQREIFPVCFSQPISLLQAASTYSSGMI